MKVGDKVYHLKPTYGGNRFFAPSGEKYEGTVVYIHPQRRFFSVEFKFKYYSFRQSFYFPARAAGDYDRRDKQNESNQHNKSQRRSGKNHHRR